MNNQVIRISPLQAAKVSAVIYFIMGALFALPMALLTMFAGAPEGAEQSSSFNLIFIVMMPFAYALMGFILVPIGCWIYNLVAGWVGGIEITLKESNDA